MKLTVKYKWLRISLYCSLSFALFVAGAATRESAAGEVFSKQNRDLIKTALKQSKGCHRHLELVRIDNKMLKVIIRL